jgi:hypothetical protein
MIRERLARVTRLKYRRLIRFAILICVIPIAGGGHAQVTIPFRLIEPDPQVQLRHILKEYGIPLCRALHAAEADRCRHPAALSDVIEVRGLNDVGSAHSILGAVIDTDRLSIRNGLNPVSLPEPGTPIRVQAAPQSAWDGDTILGRTISTVVPVPGSGDLAKDKIRLIQALVSALGTIPHVVAPRPSSENLERPREENDRKAGQQDLYFGMPW